MQDAAARRRLLLESLTETQRDAVTDGPLLVLAGPGQDAGHHQAARASIAARTILWRAAAFAAAAFARADSGGLAGGLDGGVGGILSGNRPAHPGGTFGTVALVLPLSIESPTEAATTNLWFLLVVEGMS